MRGSQKELAESHLVIGDEVRIQLKAELEAAQSNKAGFEMEEAE